MDEYSFQAEDPFLDPESTFVADESKRQRPGRKVLLAGIGALALAYDTAEESFDRFVNRGERVQSELQSRVDDVRHQNAGARGRVEQYYRTAVDALLDRANLPSKTDLDTINVKLNIVSRKLDDLQMQNVMETSAVPPASTPASPPTGDDEVT